LVFWLRPFIDSLVVVRIILFSLSCNVLHFISPCVKRNCPVAVTLNVNVVDATDNFEETIITPVTTPRITNTPILDTVFFAPTDNTNFVVLLKSASCVIINTVRVLDKSFGVCDCA
jgi:hypothetical protein